jgi:hypothetical protein
MSIKLMSAAFGTKIPTTQKFVFVALCDAANDQGECYPSIRTLCEKTSLKERAVQGAIKWLIEHGFLVIESRSGRSTLYFVRQPSEWLDYELDPRIKCTPAPDAPPQEMRETPAGDAPLPPHIMRPTPAGNAPPLHLTVIEPSIEPSIEPCQRKAQTAKDDEVEMVFNHWKSVMNSPRSRLDTKRRKVIRGALDVYSAAELMEAVDGCSMSEFHMGKNENRMKYNGIDLIFRNADQIDRFIAIAQTPKPKVDWGEPWLTEKEIVINGTDTLLMG